MNKNISKSEQCVSPEQIASKIAGYRSVSFVVNKRLGANGLLYSLAYLLIICRKDTAFSTVWKLDYQKTDTENNLQTKVLQKLSLHDASIPIEVKQLMIDFLRHCPFCMQEKIDPDDLPISIKPDADGWFFTCYACEETRCNGYIKNDPYPVN